MADSSTSQAEMLRRRQALCEALAERGIEDERALAAIANVPREAFVPADLQDEAYADRPLPIGHGQTISQPYIVALMTQLADLRPGDKVLEIGTGCGYQTAVLAATGAAVFSIEIVRVLCDEARERLAALGVRAELRCGDGHAGWPEAGPFDAIVVTAAPKRIPRALASQLALHGRLILPVGDEEQTLWVIRRTETGFEAARIAPVRFVPMTGGVGATFSALESFDIL
jgi:protein-L-isoaspartate(D-aspartate) O-methyltransferase